VKFAAAVLTHLGEGPGAPVRRINGRAGKFKYELTEFHPAISRIAIQQQDSDSDAGSSSTQPAQLGGSPRRLLLEDGHAPCCTDAPAPACASEFESGEPCAAAVPLASLPARPHWQRRRRRRRRDWQRAVSKSSADSDSEHAADTVKRVGHKRARP
jgi:hypothetical protein